MSGQHTQATARLVRDGTIFGPNGTEIDLRTEDYSAWLTIKADSDNIAEAIAGSVVEAVNTYDSFRDLEAAARELDEWWGTWLSVQPQIRARPDLIQRLTDLRAALARVEQARGETNERTP